MDPLVELDNRNSEIAVYEAERARMQRELADWDDWGSKLGAKKQALLTQIAERKKPDTVAVIIPIDDSAAFGVLQFGPEED